MSQIPSQLTAGDTWSWTDEQSGYPAPAWTATMYFENAAETFNVAATPSGAAHLFTIGASTTATKKAGRYKWSVRVSNGSDAYTVETGWLEILTNPAATGTHDPRSWARRTLEAVEAFLGGTATTMQQSMTIGPRSIARWPREELYKERDRLRAEVAAEERGSQRSKTRYIKVRLSR
jgi:hypothetical protein